MSKRGRAHPDAVAIASNALSNSSSAPVSEADVLSILTTGDGPGHLVRALFGDCAFETLDRIGAQAGLSRAGIRTAYAFAKRVHAAANADLEAEDGGG